MLPERLRDRKREDTRERLLDAGLRLSGERGYDRTTAAEIAEGAGVTERTFFRHFPTKADLVSANWRRHAAVVEAAMSAQPEDARLIEVVRAGVQAFAKRLVQSLQEEPGHPMSFYAGQLPVLTMLDAVLALESSIAEELGRRLRLSDEDVDVRIVASCSIGVLRACGHFYAQGHRRAFTATVSKSLDRLGPQFEVLERRAR